METINNQTAFSSGISSTDALWAIIMTQPKHTRRALTEKLLNDDIELGERLLLKASIERGWHQVKDMMTSNIQHGTLQDL